MIKTVIKPIIMVSGVSPIIISLLLLFLVAGRAA